MTAVSLISFPAEIIDYELRSFAWLGFSTSIDALDASTSGPTSGPARATTSARIAVRGICHRSIVRNLTDLVAQEGDEFIAIHSPRSAEHKPNYRELGRFDTIARGRGIFSFGRLALTLFFIPEAA